MILALIAPVAFAQADPVADAVAAMTDVANAYDTSGTSPVSPSSAARLRPATFEARLREASALLVAEGCTVDAVGWVGGAYRGNIADGVGGQDEAADELVTSVDLGTKVISAGTLGASTVAGAVGAADRRFRFVMDRDGSTF
ncbi:MAG: hypothetical protein KC656_28355, partial [Myxococcales bacterium]|nr:hypothetical protein [Myxococcales bacterium]